MRRKRHDYSGFGVMKLYHSPLSPYARKCRIIARLHGLNIEEIATKLDGSNGYVPHINPLGKIPALEIDQRDVLYDSSVICEFLDGLGDPILPKSGPDRWKQLKLHALGDGVSDAVYNYRYETVRPDDLHWDQIIDRHNTAMASAIDYLNGQVEVLGRPWGFGNLSVICALGYMDFRAAHLKWRDRAPNLRDWHEAFAADPIWQATNEYD